MIYVHPSSHFSEDEDKVASVIYTLGDPHTEPSDLQPEKQGREGCAQDTDAQKENSGVEQNLNTRQSLTEGQLLTAAQTVILLCLYVLFAEKLMLSST